jgi:phosphatidylglycerophosphate synthase
MLVESIEELKKICRKEKNSITLKGRMTRKVSIYITKVLLVLGFSADQTTLLRIIVGLFAGLAYTNGTSEYLLIGAFLLSFSGILDFCDGEVARYRGKTKFPGIYVDSLGHWILAPFIYTCISFGMYNMFRQEIILIFGFSLVISVLMYNVVTAGIYFFAYYEPLITIPTDETMTTKFYQIFSKIRKYQGGLFFIPIITFIDSIFSHLIIGPNTFSLLYLYMIISSLVTPFFWISFIYGFLTLYNKSEKSP